jgi:hypothetical protein
LGKGSYPVRRIDNGRSTQRRVRNPAAHCVREPFELSAVLIVSVARLPVSGLNEKIRLVPQLEAEEAIAHRTGDSGGFIGRHFFRSSTGIHGPDHFPTCSPQKTGNVIEARLIDDGPFRKSGRIAECRPLGEIRSITADPKDAFLRDCANQLDVSLVFSGQQAFGSHR